MFKKIAFAGVGIVLFASPLVTSADTLSDLQAQIQALVARVTALQSQQTIPDTTQLHPSQPDDYGTGTTAGNYCPNLSVTMQKGSRDATTGGQVSELQTFLTDYFNLDENVVVGGYFGNLTYKYLVQFQSQQSLPAFGIAGSLTRAKIAELCGGGKPVSGDAHFLALSASEVTPLSVTFVAAVGGPGYIIDFGDGVWGGIYQITPVAERSYGAPPHTYASAGTYTAKLYSFPSPYTVDCSRSSWDPSCRVVGIATITLSGQSTPTITVISPNGGEKFVKGNIFSAKWKLNGKYPIGTKICVNVTNQSTQVNNVPFYGSTGTEHCAAVDGTKDAQEGMISGHLADWLPAGMYKVRAFTDFAQNEYRPAFDVFDESDTPFYIGDTSAGSAITVTAPNGGEQINPSKEMVIKFSSTGLKSASMALYKNDQWKYWIEKDVKPSAKDLDFVSVNWTPSVALAALGADDNQGAIWKIYVTGQKTDGTGYVDDKSDAPFSFLSTPTLSGSIDQTLAINWSNAVLLSGSSQTKYVFVALVKSDYTGPKDWQSIYATRSYVAFSGDTVTPVAGNRWSLTLSGVSTGSYTALLYDNSNGNQSLLASGPLTVTTLSSPSPSCTITAVPSAPMVGGPITLTWTSQNARDAMIAIPVTGENIQSPINGSRVVTVNTLGRANFSLHLADGNGATGLCTTSVEVTPAASMTFAINGSSERNVSVPKGTPATLVWDSTNNYACSLSADGGFSDGTTTKTSSSGIAQTPVYSYVGTSYSYTFACWPSASATAPTVKTITVNVVSGTVSQIAQANNLANALTALEAALKAMMAKLGR